MSVQVSLVLQEIRSTNRSIAGWSFREDGPREPCHISVDSCLPRQGLIDACMPALGHIASHRRSGQSSIYNDKECTNDTVSYHEWRLKNHLGEKFRNRQKKSTLTGRAPQTFRPSIQHARSILLGDTLEWRSPGQKSSHCQSIGRASSRVNRRSVKKMP